MSLKIVRRSLPDCGWGYSPPGDGPFPAILLLHGSDGSWSGWNYRTAAILAAHGFLAIPFGYSKGGNNWNAGNIIDVPLDRTAEAWLPSAPIVCREVGSDFTELRAVPNTRCC